MQYIECPAIIQQLLSHYLCQDTPKLKCPYMAGVLSREVWNYLWIICVFWKVSLNQKCPVIQGLQAKLYCEKVIFSNRRSNDSNLVVKSTHIQSENGTSCSWTVPRIFKFWSDVVSSVPTLQVSFDQSLKFKGVSITMVNTYSCMCGETG